MGFLLKEHTKGKIICNDDFDEENFDRDRRALTLNKILFDRYKVLQSKSFREDYYCYKVSRTEEEICIEADYFIGVDWLIKGSRYIYVEPKINSATADFFKKQLAKDDVGGEAIITIFDKQAEALIAKEETFREIDYLKMLLDLMSDSIVSKECSELVRIDWQEQPISLNQNKDQLTPFLVVQFLQLLRQIVRKGLKKSYYKVQENLTNRVKGKILVGQQIKQNTFKNRLTKTYCEYQVFGKDNVENRFLKKVFHFATSYIENAKELFKSNKPELDQIINFCRPAFEQIGSDLKENQLRQFKYNPFFKEYKEALKIGNYILKRFAFNIIKTTTGLRETPPFWIDMPRLFELYVYQKLLKANKQDTNKIMYQFSTYGNALDILIKNGSQSIVIDAKYKMHYKYGQVHQDMRQVAGYARLKKVLKEVGFMDKEGGILIENPTLPCLIIFPDVEKGLNLETEEELVNFELDKLLVEENQIKSYYKVYKLGIKLPIIYDGKI